MNLESMYYSIYKSNFYFEIEAILLNPANFIYQIVFFDDVKRP